jgi:hypothetical protein
MAVSLLLSERYNARTRGNVIAGYEVEIVHKLAIKAATGGVGGSAYHMMRYKVESKLILVVPVCVIILEYMVVN